MINAGYRFGGGAGGGGGGYTFGFAMGFFGLIGTT